VKSASVDVFLSKKKWVVHESKEFCGSASLELNWFALEALFYKFIEKSSNLFLG
jgi:hypothetical protein